MPFPTLGPAPGSSGIRGETDREGPSLLLGVDQIAQLPAEVERQDLQPVLSAIKSDPTGLLTFLTAHHQFHGD